MTERSKGFRSTHRGYAPLVSPSRSDKLDLSRVDRPMGHSPGITTVEQYRVARSPN
jgi:hypothetical protein